MKCKTCRKEYSSQCDYRQGRCPQHPGSDLLTGIIKFIKKNFFVSKVIVILLYFKEFLCY